MQCQRLKTYMETGRVVFLPARSIQPNPAQPRKIFREEALRELAESIRQHGILQPLSVRRVGTAYELIAGERRLRAAKQAGVKCAIGSSGCRENVQFIIENLAIEELIDASISGSDVTHGKPHPEPYLMGLEKAGVQASEAIVVENAPLGVEAAHAAGIFTRSASTS